MAVLRPPSRHPVLRGRAHSTIDPAIADGSGIPIEERDASEVLPVAIEGVEVWNPAFDVTPPAGLITRIVTERGAFEPDKLVY